jgi:hypothetical protein
VSRTGSRSLFAATLLTLKWPVLAVLPPRLSLIAFNFCQPFLINRAVTFSQEPVTSQTTNIGYGLIGAYVLVFVGIAVRISSSGTAHLCGIFADEWSRYPQANISTKLSGSSP